MTELGDSVVGEIGPGGPGQPVFRRVHTSDSVRRVEVPNVRPCEHNHFVLDEKWRTVTCGRCQQQVDSFGLLVDYADWEDAWRLRQRSAEQAERRMILECLRSMSRTRAYSTVRDEILHYLRGPDPSNAPLYEVRKYRNGLREKIEGPRGAFYVPEIGT